MNEMADISNKSHESHAMRGVKCGRARPSGHVAEGEDGASGDDGIGAPCRTVRGGLPPAHPIVIASIAPWRM